MRFLIVIESNYAKELHEAKLKYEGECVPVTSFFLDIHNSINMQVLKYASKHILIYSANGSRNYPINKIKI